MLSNAQSDPQLRELVTNLQQAINALTAYLEGERAQEVRASGGPILTLVEVARAVRLSRVTLKRGFPAGRFPFLFREGKRILASGRELDRWMERKIKKGAVN